jgi:thiaminase
MINIQKRFIMRATEILNEAIDISEIVYKICAVLEKNLVNFDSNQVQPLLDELNKAEKQGLFNPDNIYYFDQALVSQYTNSVSSNIIAAIYEILKIYPWAVNEDGIPTVTIEWGWCGERGYAHYEDDNNRIILSVKILSASMMASSHNQNINMQQQVLPIAKSVVHELVHHIQNIKRNGNKESNKSLINLQKQAETHDDKIYKKFLEYLIYLGRPIEITARANELAGNIIQFIIDNNKFYLTSPAALRKFIDTFTQQQNIPQFNRFEELVDAFSVNLSKEEYQKLKNLYQKVRERFMKQLYTIVYNKFHKQ